MNPTDEVKDRDRLKQAVLTIRRLQEKIGSLERANHEPIAVIGLGCKFPGGVVDPDGLWQLLDKGRDAISSVPLSRWDPDAYFDADPAVAGKMYTLAGGFIDDIDKFDAEFFGISPREAQKIDPQHRIFLEVAWEALEHAGIPPSSLSGTKTGVYVGITGVEYGVQQSMAGLSEVDAYTMTGTKLNFIAGRLSFLLGLQGPSMAIDTACSSSLVALHVATRSLRVRDCNVALVGGVNAMLTPEQTIAECKAGMLSPEGRCKTFDANADGFVRGEGCGVVVLKRLSDAVADGDPIAAVIPGSAVNQDGASSGLTVPNRLAQEEVIQFALKDAGLEPDDIDFVEAHGTATPLGDPIEVRALANVFGSGSSRRAPLQLGTVKTNLGHLESAAGIAGFIKTVLSLTHEKIPPHLHLKKLNPAVAWEDIAINVPTKGFAWPTQDHTRRAGVSSFGASGTNAHVLVEEWRGQEFESQFQERTHHVLAFSAKSEEALKKLAGRYAKCLNILAAEQFADACFTSTVGRSHFAHRLAIPADSVTSAKKALSAFAAGHDDSLAITGNTPLSAPKVALLFSGQGAQYASMGKTLYESQGTFRRRVDKCNELLLPHLDRPLLDVMFADGDDGALIHQTTYTQPALFTFEYAMAGLWMSWGVKPTVLLGHSIGEYAAACISGMLDLPDALKLVAARGRLMGELPAGGAMAAVFAPLAVVEKAIKNSCGLSIAAINGPESVVISGDSNAIDKTLEILAEQSVDSRRLEVSHAFHSAHLDPMLDEFTEHAGKLPELVGAIPVVSNVTGDYLHSRDAADPQYWRRQTRNAVQFQQCMHKLASLDVDIFLEVGPAATLLGMGGLCLPDHAGTWLPSLRPGWDDWQQISETLAGLYVNGVAIDWQSVHLGNARTKLRLPTYPFERKRHWLDEAPVSAPNRSIQRSQMGHAHPLLGTRLPSPLEVQQFESHINLETVNLFRDHRVFGTPVVSATAYLEMALAAARDAVGEGALLEDVFIHAPLTLVSGDAMTMQLILEPADDVIRFSISTMKAGKSDHGDWTQHVSGRIRNSGNSYDDQDEFRDSPDVGVIESRCGEEVPVGRHYRDLSDSGVELGSSYQTIERMCRGDGVSLGWVSLNDPKDKATYVMHPGLLDGCFQVAREALPAVARAPDSSPVIPMRIGRLRLHKSHVGRVLVHARMRAISDVAQTDFYDVDLQLSDADGHPIADIDGLRLIRVERKAFDSSMTGATDDVLYELEWRDKPLSADTSVESTEQWLVFGRGDSLSNTLIDRLRRNGRRVWNIEPGDQFEVTEAGDCRIRPDVPEDFDTLIEKTVEQDSKPTVICYGWGAGLPDFDTERKSIEESGMLLCQGLLHLAQAAERHSTMNPMSLIVATRDAQGDAPSLAGVVQAPLWGLGRVIMTEQPRLDCRLIDLSPGHEKAADKLIDEMSSSDGERQIRYHGDRRTVARLAAYRDRAQATSASLRVDSVGKRSEPYRLVLETPGLPDSLSLQKLSRKAPGSGEVEIEVCATGLNFRDILVALDVYQGEAGPLGGECAGRVVAVGPGVDRVSVGDKVTAFAIGSSASHVVTNAELTWPIPKGLSFETAAGIPIAYLTAAYCLDHLCGMSAGDRVLIHCAAGGVGMAAVQLARHAGAEIFGTAGSPEKRELVTAQGVQHVMDSRSLDFAAETMEITGGKGLDIVLNSLAGEFIEKGLSLVHGGGRFVEIGRTDTWTPEKVAELHPDVDYWSVLLGDICAENPALIQSMGAKIMEAIESGELQPLPISAYPIEKAVEAFRFMAQGKHTGKLVLTANFAEPEVDAPRTVSPSHAYLITGGLGGLGLEVARWLSANKAGHIVLMGRNLDKDNSIKTLAALRASGTQITVVQGDVSSTTDVRQVLAHIDNIGVPLGGVVHAAGVLDDGVITDQNWARTEAVMMPKVAGSWLLHELTRDRDLHLFILFSSVSSLVGSAGQGGYAAANAFLDSLARWRRSNGLVGLSINWGPWSDAGMFVDSGRAGARSVAAYGFIPLSSEKSLSAMTRALKSDATQLGVFQSNWEKSTSEGDTAHSAKLLSELVSQPLPQVGTAQPDEFRVSLAAAPAKRRVAMLQRRLQTEVAAVLRNDSAAIKVSVGFRELGMDSLMSVELRNRLEKLLGGSFVSTLAFDYPNIISLTEFLLRDGVVKLREETTNKVSLTDNKSSEDADSGTAIEDLLNLSNEDAEALLLAELNNVPETEG